MTNIAIAIERRMRTAWIIFLNPYYLWCFISLTIPSTSLHLSARVCVCVWLFHFLVTHIFFLSFVLTPRSSTTRRRGEGRIQHRDPLGTFSPPDLGSVPCNATRLTFSHEPDPQIAIIEPWNYLWEAIFLHSLPPMAAWHRSVSLVALAEDEQALASGALTRTHYKTRKPQINKSNKANWTIMGMKAWRDQTCLKNMYIPDPNSRN